MRLSVHHKITLSIFILVFVLLAGVYFYLSITLKEETYERIKTSLMKDVVFAATYVEDVTAGELSTEDYDKVADKIGSCLQLRCTIINDDGTVLGDSDLSAEAVRVLENHADRPEVRDAKIQGTGLRKRYSTTLKTDLLYVVRQVTTPTMNGFVRLAMPLSAITQIQAHVSKVLLIAFCIALCVTFIVSFGSSILISQPIRYIAMTAKKIADGNYGASIHVRTGDEIEDLAHAFNEMNEQIKHRIEELNTNNARIEAILLSMFDGIMVVNDKGAIVFTNAKLKEIFQTEKELIGKQPIEVIRKAEVQQIADSILREEKGVVIREIALLSPQERTLLVHATSILRNGHKEGAVLVFHDITELKKLEQVRKDFVANVSHELRTPLTSIKGYAETLLEGALDDKKNAQEFINIILKESNRLDLLVNDLLDLSRFESDKHHFVMKKSLLNQIVQKAVEQMSAQARKKSITISINLPEKLPAAMFDETAIVQVLLNLLDNAIKYTPEKGRIYVDVVLKQAMIEISIKDTGVGISENDLPRIFERFYRVDKTRSCELSGTGLGLSIAKHIVLAHNGTISVESVIDQGSTFRFTIPIA
jgi:two-component system, OmpR family, phosphate regulon sensor histidine kinase PhoR